MWGFSGLRENDVLQQFLYNLFPNRISVSTLLLAAASGWLILAVALIAASWTEANSFPHTKPIRKTSTNVRMSAAVAMMDRGQGMF